jgi:hypothetical protein
LLSLLAFYAARGVPLDALAAASPERIAFLQGARALYYEETVELMSQAVAVGISKILPGGDRNGE